MSEVFIYTDDINYRGTCYLHLNAIAYIWTRNSNEAMIYLIGRDEPIVLNGKNAEQFWLFYKEMQTQG